MNERIKELAAQARNYALGQKQHYEGVHSAEQCMEDYREVYNTKFAELIVQECSSTLEEKIYRSIDNEGDEIWADLILKEHFGVKE